MIIDTHCHLHDPALADVRKTLVRALTHDCWGVIAVGCDPATNETTLAAADSLPKAVWACAGFHPEWTHLGGFDLEQVEAQIRARHSRLVALGEVGLPWYSLQHAADVAGRMAALLVDGMVPAGHWEASWDGTVEGRRASGGVWFVRMTVGGQIVSRRILLIR